MGLSASQARLLSLTARLSDLELNMQTISNSKIRLADASEEASKKYTTALDKEKYSILTGVNSSGEETYTDLTYNNLTGADSPLLAQYCVTDSNGNIIVRADEAQNFRNSSSLEDFLSISGIRTITYPNGMTKEEYEAQYNQLSANVTIATSALDDFGQAHIRGYLGAGQWSYDTQERNDETDISTTGRGEFGDPHYEITTANGTSVYFTQKATAGQTYNIFWGDNIGIYGTMGAHSGGCVVSSATITTGSNTLTYTNNDQLTLKNADGTATAVADTGGQRIALYAQDGSIEGYYIYNSRNNKLTIMSSDYNGTDDTGLVELTAHGGDGVFVDPSGDFADLGGILGSIITNNRALTEDECNAFLVSSSNIDTDYQYDGYTTLTRNSEDANASSEIIFLDDSGREVTDSNQIANYQATYTSLLAAYGSAVTALDALGEATVNDTGDVAYYTNLYNRMQEGYITIDNNNLNSADWIQSQIQCGNLLLEKCVDSKWQSMSWSTCTDIAQDSDDTDVAKAEAEYESTMAKIESKDKRFDLELKNIDTEHSAIQTEIDSVKKVIDKNIERSFKMFDA